MSGLPENTDIDKILKICPDCEWQLKLVGKPKRHIIYNNRIAMSVSTFLSFFVCLPTTLAVSGVIGYPNDLDYIYVEFALHCQIMLLFE